MRRKKVRTGLANGSVGKAFAIESDDSSSIPEARVVREAN